MENKNQDNEEVVGENVIEFFRGLSNSLEIRTTDSALIVISKLLLRSFFAEINNSTTRRNVEVFVSNYFGIKAICDEANNPPNVVDKNQLVVDLEMEKPVRLVLG